MEFCKDAAIDGWISPSFQYSSTRAPALAGFIRRGQDAKKNTGRGNDALMSGTICVAHRIRIEKFLL